jgi:hypothetical protein
MSREEKAVHRILERLDRTRTLCGRSVEYDGSSYRCLKSANRAEVLFADHGGRKDFTCRNCLSAWMKLTSGA